MDALAFVSGELPPAPARVLEVGCGAGELARTVAAAGYDVVAVDPVAPEGRIFRRTTLEELDDPGPFDAVVANRSLHHVDALATALDAIALRLERGGRLLVVEWAHERLDDATAEWFRGRLAVLAAAGHGPPAPAGIDELRAGYADLHTGEAVLAAARDRFDERRLEWFPSLHLQLDGVASEALEETLVAAGAIQATGFCWVGERRATG